MQSVTVPGGDLFSLAAQLLGDAQQWVRIAAANDLRDTTLTGITTLRIPQAVPAGSTGGLPPQ